VVAPGFLQNPEVRQWLNGIEPAWTMLEFDSLNALRHEPSASNRAIRLEPDLADAEISGSAVTANALTLLRRAAEAGGLKLTATGNLSRAVVDEMFGIIQAPDYDKTESLSVQKVINEPDILPLHFVRILAQAAKLLRSHRGKLVTTPLGRRILTAEQHGPLQALLFHVALWRMNLPYFDGYPLDSWPQSEVGVILWSLSASALVRESDEAGRAHRLPGSADLGRPTGEMGTANWFEMTARRDAQQSGSTPATMPSPNRFRASGNAPTQHWERMARLRRLAERAMRSA
jgi:hypothetical protein